MGDQVHQEIATISAQTVDKDLIRHVQSAFEARMFNPGTDESATERLVKTHTAWQELGKITVFTSGVFDLMHPDHSGYLLHAKSEGASIAYDHLTDQSWTDLTKEQQDNFTKFALGKDLVKLVVSVDGDRSVATRKSSKAGSERPIFSWSTRAFQVAKDAHILPNSGVQSALTADAVTVHGPEDFDKCSPHHSIFSLVDTLRPNVWVAFDESTDIIETAQSVSCGAERVHVIETSERHYFEDATLGKLSTSRVVERIIGK